MAGYLIGGRFLTGAITIRQVIPRDAEIELELNSSESIKVTLALPMLDPATGTGISTPEELIPGRDFIGWVENGVILAAGQIQGDPFTFPGKSEVIAAGMDAYFENRFVLPPLASGQLPRSVSSQWSGLSLRTIAKRVVQQAISHPGAALPIDFEPDIIGTHEREYPGSDGMRVSQALTNLTNVDGGPDIAFRPKMAEDRRHVRWELLTGDPQLTQGGSDHYWDVSAPGPHASVASLVRDGRDLASRSFMAGTTLRNMLQDSSFEGTVSGDSWKTGSNAHAYTTGNQAPFDGSARGAWTSLAAGWAYLDYARGVSIEEGQPYTFSTYMRTSAAVTGQVLLRFHNTEGAVMAEHSQAIPTTASTWTRVHVTATAPEGAKTATVYIGGLATAGGQVMGTDAAMLMQSADLHPYTPDEIQVQARADNTALLEAGFPLMESWENRPSVIRESTLQAYADESVVRYSAHTETFTLTVKRDQHPKLGSYWPGDWARIRIGKNPRIPAGTYRVRIVRISFRAVGDVTIECAPERVAGGYPVPASSRAWLKDQLRTLAARVDEQNRG